MLNERFLARLETAFPTFYDRASADAMADAARLLRDAKGDAQKALLRARLESSLRLWWPYVKGSVPVVGNERDAMESFTRLVLTVDHIMGSAPLDVDQARLHVVSVLRESLDVERLRTGLRGEETKGAAAAGAGLTASLAAFLAPVRSMRAARKWVRFVPVPLRWTLGAVIVAAVLSIPLVAGYSAGRHAETAVRATRPVRAGGEP